MHRLWARVAGQSARRPTAAKPTARLRVGGGMSVGDPTTTRRRRRRRRLLRRLLCVPPPTPTEHAHHQQATIVGANFSMRHACSRGTTPARRPSPVVRALADGGRQGRRPGGRRERRGEGVKFRARGEACAVGNAATVAAASKDAFMLPVALVPASEASPSGGPRYLDAKGAAAALKATSSSRESARDTPTPTSSRANWTNGRLCTAPSPVRKMAATRPTEATAMRPA